MNKEIEDKARKLFEQGKINEAIAVIKSVYKNQPFVGGWRCGGDLNTTC